MLERYNTQFKIFDNVNDGFVIYETLSGISENHKIFNSIYSNSAFKTYFNGESNCIDSNEEVTELNDLLNEYYSGAMSDKSPKSEEIIFKCGKYFSVSISELQDDLVLMILHDITQDIITKNKLGIYKSFLENAKDIIFIISTEGKILDANKEAVKAYGYTLDELLKMDIFELRNPGKIEFVKKQFERAKIKGTQFETLHYKKNKEVFPVEVKSTGVSDGNESFVISIVRDITNRKKRTLELNRLASIVESSDDAIIGVSLGGIITSWNRGAEKLYGYVNSEIVGTHISILLPDGKEDITEYAIHQIKNNEKFDQYETIRKRKDGEIVRVIMSVSPIYDIEGNIQGISVTARDVSERYLLTKKLVDYEEKWKLVNELLIANTFQASLMSTTTQFDSADMFGKYLPCSLVGGDLYDCIEIGKSIWFIIADVTGHGVVSAMVSTMIKGLFNNSIHNYSYPNEVLENMNSICCDMLGEYHEIMASAFIGVIRGNDLFYSNAGHPYPLIINPDSKKIKAIKQNGYLLALKKNAKYELKQEEIGKGDNVLLYSDGLFELEDDNSMEYWDRISEFSLPNLNLIKDNPRSYIEKLINTFQNKTKDYEDDISIMLIRKK